jgi:hypothetical protein
MAAPTIEREFDYRPRPRAYLAPLGICAVLTAFALCGGSNLILSTETRRARIFRGAVVLSEGASGTLSAIGVVVCGTFAVLLGYHGLRTLFARGRVAFTPEAILVPKGLYAAGEKRIEYPRIRSLEVFAPDPRRPDQRLLAIVHGTNGRAAIDEAWLPSSKDFDDVHDLLKRRVAEAGSREP